jgi:hypothetical protein
MREKMRHELASPSPSWGAGEEGLRDPADGGACGRIRTTVMCDAHALRAGGCGMTALWTGGRHAAVCRVWGLESMVAEADSAVGILDSVAAKLDSMVVSSI